MKKQVGHARETIAMATTKGGGKAMSTMPKGGGNMMQKPKVHVMNKLK